MKQWCRLWNECPLDPKWPGIARAARARLPWWRRWFCRLRQNDVVALWTALMAASNERDGVLGGFRVEDWAAATGTPRVEAAAIFAELEARGMIVQAAGGAKLASWDRRNPAREDPTAAERQRRHRGRVRQGAQPGRRGAQPALFAVPQPALAAGNVTRDVTQPHAPDSDSESPLSFPPLRLVEAEKEERDLSRDRKKQQDLGRAEAMREAGLTLPRDKFEAFLIGLQDDTAAARAELRRFAKAAKQRGRQSAA